MAEPFALLWAGGEGIGAKGAKAGPEAPCGVEGAESGWGCREALKPVRGGVRSWVDEHHGRCSTWVAGPVKKRGTRGHDRVKGGAPGRRISVVPKGLENGAPEKPGSKASICKGIESKHLQRMTRRTISRKPWERVFRRKTTTTRKRPGRRGIRQWPFGRRVVLCAASAHGGTRQGFSPERLQKYNAAGRKKSRMAGKARSFPGIRGGGRLRRMPMRRPISARDASVRSRSSDIV